MTMQKGIDVSTYQKDINWSKVKADGIDFAIIKATQGRSERNPFVRFFTDSKFRQNITAAYSWGMRCGVYHYFTAKTAKEAREEAEYFCSVIEPFRENIKLHAFVDVESMYLPKKTDTLTELVKIFCCIVEENGFKAGVYTNPNFLTYRLNWDYIRRPLWLALWRDPQLLPTVEQFPDLKIWQYGSSDVFGINGKVDSNLMIVDDMKKPDPNPIKEKAETEKALEWIAEEKIMLGNEKGDMMADKPLTRGQFAVMLCRYHNKYKKE